MDKGTCSVEGCEKSVTARGLCRMHYMRLRRTGSVELNAAPTPCLGCSTPVARASNGNQRSRCSECRRQVRTEYARAHDAANPDLVRARRDRNRPSVELRRMERTASYRRNRDETVARRRAKYWANPEPIRQQGREWARLHPGQVRANNRRYLDRVAEGAIGPPIHRPTIYARDGWICQLCFAPVDPEMRWPDPWSASLDHIVPLSVDPIHTPENVRLTHLRCNQRRGNKI